MVIAKKVKCYFVRLRDESVIGVSDEINQLMISVALVAQCLGDFDN